MKGILFFSFWQSIVISILVAAGAISKLGPYTDAEHISVGLTDTLICLEMPLFAFAHMFAFSHTDYIDPHRSYVARMPMYYAFRDAFGILDVVEDSKATLHGEGMDYREFEPAEGLMHQGTGRDRRIRAGLRYSKGGQKKYWLPRRATDAQQPGRIERGVNRVVSKVGGPDREEVHAPLFAQESDNVVNLAPDLRDSDESPDIWDNRDADVEDGFELPFGDLDDGDEELFDHCKKYLFGDYNYPVIDVSSEYARTAMWDEEERVLRNERGAWFSPIRGSKGQAALERREGPAWQGYGAIDSTTRSTPRGRQDEATGIRRGDGDRLIDFEQDRGPAPEQRGVKMKWTKVKDQLPRSASHSRSPHLHSVSRLQTSSPQDHLPAGSNRSPNLLRALPSMSRNSSKVAESPVLPDAVDLVVEDDRAGQEQQTRERRKGESTIRGSGLRKVYKSGFVGQSQQGVRTYGEVEVHEPDGERRGAAGDEILDALGAERHESEANEDQGDPVFVGRAEGVIARAGTPPEHARVVLTGFEDNPWA